MTLMSREMIGFWLLPGVPAGSESGWGGNGSEAETSGLNPMPLSKEKQTEG
jgi:hypothetical protein